MSTGQFDARVRKLGNYIRCLLPIMKNSSSARIVTSGWCDPLQIVLDEDVKDNRSQADFSRQIWETWGYGSYTPATTFTSGNVNVIDGPGGADTGVWPIQYFCDNQNPGLENRSEEHTSELQSLR